MQPYAHFILTRFNVRMPGWAVTPDDAWLRQRFDLFERYCLPSVKAQSNQDFKWLVFFDATTPECHRARVRQYVRYENFVPVFVSEFTSVQTTRAIQQQLPDVPQYLITSRLDNDDALAPNYVRLLQSQFCEQTSQFINFAYGYVWDGSRLYLRRLPCNAFIAMIERYEGFRTVWCTEHQRARQVGEVLEVKAPPSWLVVIHGNNVGNRAFGARRPREHLMRYFPFLDPGTPHREPSLLEWADCAVQWIPYYSLLLPASNVRRWARTMMERKSNPTCVKV